MNHYSDAQLTINSSKGLIKMKIAGLQKTSLIDYPDQIATVIFTQGCNLRCPYCHNPELIPEPKETEDYLVPEQIWSFLADRKDLIDGVVITGGEPTLQPDLKAVISKIKKLGLKVKLDTNGADTEIIRNLTNEDLVDYIAMDVKLPLSAYNHLDGGQLTKAINDSIQFLKQTDTKSEFRTTVVPSLHTAEEIEAISRKIAGAEEYYLQNFEPGNTLDPELEEKTQFPPAKLEEFKEIASNYVQEVKIRN